MEASTSSIAMLDASTSSAAMEASTSSIAMLDASTSSAAMLDASTSSGAMVASTSSQQLGEAAGAALYPYGNAPGVRFVPTDQELILCYLRRRLRGEELPTQLVLDADVYAEHPQELTKELGPSVGDYWYVFTQRNRKYAKGGRPSRSTGDTGRWKSVGKNTDVTYGKDKETIGFRNGLAYEVFVYDDDGGDSKSKKKRVKKTDWKMNEFVDTGSNRPVSSDPENFMLLNEWVLCKITRKPEKKKKKKGENPGASPEDEEEPLPMLMDEQPMDTSPDPDTSQQVQAQETAPGLLGNGANWSDSTADSQVEGSGSGSGSGAGLEQPADEDPFGYYDLEPLSEGCLDDAFTHEYDPWAWNQYSSATDTDSFCSRLRTPSDPDPMEVPLGLLPPAYPPQHVDVVTDPPSSADDGLDEPTKAVIRKRKEHAKASGDDDPGKKGSAAVKKTSRPAK